MRPARARFRRFKAKGGRGGGGGGGSANGGRGVEAGRGTVAPAVRYDPELERALSSYQAEANMAQSRFGEDQALAQMQTFGPDPFSQQNLLQRNLAMKHRGNQLQMASRGMLYDGALEELQARTAFEGQADQEQLLRGFAENRLGADRQLQDTLAGLTGQSEEAIWAATQAHAQDYEGASSGIGKRRKFRRKGKRRR